MKKALLIYGSSTGNTEELSQYVSEGLQDGGQFAVTAAPVGQFKTESLADYDFILLGCSTWNEGEPQEDFQPFLDHLAGVSLAGKQAAVFGPGDSRFDHFCEAVDLIEKRLQAQGAHLVSPGLKVDGAVDRAAEQARRWGRQVRDRLVVH